MYDLRLNEYDLGIWGMASDGVHVYIYIYRNTHMCIYVYIYINICMFIRSGHPTAAGRSGQPTA